MSYVEKLAKQLLSIIHVTAFILLAVLILALLGYGTDDSDASAWNRSGLKLHTDHLTGCQYFQAPNGGLIQRLDRDGRHICITKGGAA
jgi:hypothetical protein